MKIEIVRIAAENFKKYESFTHDFSERVNITGKNGEGKSSIAEMVSWTLFGTDAMGTNFDPTPVKEFEGNISVKLLLSVNDEKYLFTRSIEKGKNKFYINEVPKKATEYDEVIKSLITKQLFLTIFTPAFFPSQHWKEQREQLLSYVEEPFNKDVFKEMTAAHVKALEAPLKKHTLNELHKLHGDRFKKREADFNRAATQVKTLEEQLQKFTGSNQHSLEEIEQKLKDVQSAIQQVEAFNEEVRTKRMEIQSSKNAELFVLSEIEKKKEMVKFLKEQSEHASCEMCGQNLEGEVYEQHKQKTLARLESVKQEGKDLVAELGEVRKLMEEQTTPPSMKETTELKDEANRCRSILVNSDQLKSMIADVERYQAEKEKARLEKIESMRIIEAIKTFVDKKAELQVKQVNDLFERISVKLFEKQKNGDLKQAFELEMEGKPYSKLSTAEKIICGLELIEVIQEKGDILAPTFIDNAESIIQLDTPSGQALIATVQNAPLTIENMKLAKETAR